MVNQRVISLLLRRVRLSPAGKDSGPPEEVLEYSDGERLRDVHVGC